MKNKSPKGAEKSIMRVNRRAASSWNRDAHAYDHYLEFLSTKRERFTLTFTDLVYIKNFKGGSAVIAEPTASLRAKLRQYEVALTAFSALPESRRLARSRLNAIGSTRSVRTNITAE